MKWNAPKSIHLSIFFIFRVVGGCLLFSGNRGELHPGQVTCSSQGCGSPWEHFMYFIWKTIQRDWQRATLACLIPAITAIIYFTTGESVLSEAWLRFSSSTCSAFPSLIPIKNLHLDMQESKFNDWLIRWLTGGSGGQSRGWQSTHTCNFTAMLTHELIAIGC